MKFTWKGETYETVDQTKMNWIEVSLLEEKTGVTSEELSADRRLAGRALVTAAVCWISIKRQNPTVKWEDFALSPVEELHMEEDEPAGEEAPTVRPADDPLDRTDGSTSTRSDTSTSATSPASSGSDPGNGTRSPRRKGSRSSST